MKTSKSKWGRCTWVLILILSFTTALFSQNLLDYGGFETADPDDPNFPEGWWIEYNGTPEYTTITLDNTVSHSGNSSIKFHTVQGVTSGDIVVMPEHAPDTMYVDGLYKFSYWVKTEGSSVHSVAIQNLWRVGTIADPLSGTNDWTYREGIIKFKNEAWLSDPNYEDHFLSLWFNSDSSAEAGTAWYDDISVELLAIAPSMPSDTLEATYASNQVSLEWGAASEGSNPIDYYMVKRVIQGQDSPNLLSNPSFEDPNDDFDFADEWGPFFWATTDEQTWTDTDARTGDFSVMISASDTANGGVGWIAQDLFAPEGTRGFDVYVKGYVKTEDVIQTEGGSGAFVQIFRDWWTDIKGISGTNDWTMTEDMEANVGSGMSVNCNFGNYHEVWEDTSKTAGQAWYDDVSAVVFDSIGQTTGLTYTDADILTDTTYYYTVRAVDTEGYLGDAQLVTVKTTGGVGVEDEIATPYQTKLVGNYPNPFNPQTTIAFSIGEVTDVEIAIYDVLGRKVAQLVERKYQPGEYQISWQPNGEYASGVYFYELRTNSYIQQKKMILMK